MSAYRSGEKNSPTKDPIFDRIHGVGAVVPDPKAPNFRRLIWHGT